LTGKSFELAFALETADGKIGLFKKFKAQVKSSDELEVEAEAETEMEHDGDAEYELEELIEYPEYEEAAEAEEETATARSFPTGFCASSFLPCACGNRPDEMLRRKRAACDLRGRRSAGLRRRRADDILRADAQYSKAETAIVCNNSAGAQVDCSALSMPMDGETVEDKTTALFGREFFCKINRGRRRFPTARRLRTPTRRVAAPQRLRACEHSRP
jgi:hypothetical protein